MNIQWPWISRKKHEFAVDALKYIHESDIRHRDEQIEDLRHAIRIMDIEFKLVRVPPLYENTNTASEPISDQTRRRGGFRTKAAAAAMSTLPAAPDSISELEHRTKSQGGKV